MTASGKGLRCSSHQIGACFITSQLGNVSSAVGCHLPKLILIAVCEVINILALSSCASCPDQNTYQHHLPNTQSAESIHEAGVTYFGSDVVLDCWGVSR